MAGWGWRAGGLFLSLRETDIPNLSTLLSLEPLEKVPGGWWVVVVVYRNFSVQLRPKLNNIHLGTFAHPTHYFAAAGENDDLVIAAINFVLNQSL